MKLFFRILFGLITLALMVFIFIMSHESAEVSSGTSGSFIYKVLDAFVWDFKNLDAVKQNSYVDSLQNFFRKFAHFAVYAALGVFTCAFYLTFNFKCKRIYYLSQLTGSAYAVSDEIHQLFISGRSGQLSDVLLDSAGVMCGVLFVLLMFLIIVRRTKGLSIRKQGS